MVNSFRKQNRRITSNHTTLLVLFSLLIAVGVALLGGAVSAGSVSAGVASSGSGASAPFEPTMSVYFLDVDQGDATLLVGEQFTILIDAGRHDRSEVVSLLKGIGVEFIDLFIATHPHADHIGQCAAVINAFPVGEVWMSGDVHTTRTFERCIDAIVESDAGYYEPRAGEVFHVGGARIEVIHPAHINGDLNNGSVGVRILYDDIAFLLTGDAEQEAEQQMLVRGHELAAPIVKLGHHGSRTSSTEPFLRRTDAEVAIYSAGADNSYGHPHEETLRTVKRLGITLFGTDVNGTIRVDTDGVAYRVVVERGGPVISPKEGAHVASHGVADVRDIDRGGCRIDQVDINGASSDELTRIIHVGPAIAARIVSERPFDSVDDLLRVSGIGEQRLSDIKEQDTACVRG